MKVVDIIFIFVPLTILVTSGTENINSKRLYFQDAILLGAAYLNILILYRL